MTAITAVIAVGADGRRERVRLGGVISRGGAAGRVEAIGGDSDRVAKIYHDPAAATAARERLLAMLLRPPNLKPPRLNGVEYVQLAWPDALLADTAGRLLGFRMPRVPLDRAVPLECLLHPAQRRAENLPEDYGLRVFAAANLAGVLAELHRLGHHMVDLKPLNCYVYRETMFVAVLDCDGFSIAGPERRFPAAHFSDEYRCPESAGRSPQDLGEEQDLFALAVVVFQLLNDGIHPFDGRPAPSASVPSSLQEKINARLYPYGAGRNGSLRPHPMSLYSCLEDETQRLFDRAFTATPGRPSAAEWRDHLRGLIEDRVLVRCTKNADHAHFSKACGLCAKDAAVRAAALRPSPAPTPPPRARPARRRWLRRAPPAPARPAPSATAYVVRTRPMAPAAVTPASVSTGVGRAFAGSLAAAAVAGGVGGVVGLAAAFGALPYPTGPLALVLTVAVIAVAGLWLEGRHGGGRGLAAALIALVPTWLLFPEVYTAASRLPAPAALGVTAAIVALVPGFTFSYLRARRPPVAYGRSLPVRRFVAGVAGIVILVACQLIAVAALEVRWTEAGAGGPALPEAVEAVVDRARQSLIEVVDRVTQNGPAEPAE